MSDLFICTEPAYPTAFHPRNMPPNTRHHPEPAVDAADSQAIRDAVLKKLAEARKKLPRDRHADYQGDMHGSLIFASPVPASNGHGKH